MCNRNSTATAKSGPTSSTAHLTLIAEVSHPDPIKFYAEIDLFDGKLHAKGALHMLV